MKDTITYPVVVEKAIWKKWKKTLPRDKTLNEAIVELITKDMAGQTGRLSIKK